MNILWEVKLNYCKCHPETCGCNPWALYKGEYKHSTYFNKETALEICVAMQKIEIEERKREINRLFPR